MILLLAVGLGLMSAGAWSWGGGIGLGSAWIGLGVSTANFYALHLLTSYLGKVAGDRPVGATEQLATAGAFLLKFPLLIFGFLVVRDWGQRAIECFLLGLLLSYVGLVYWGHRRAHAQKINEV